jgi:hypothetical protein
MNRMHSPLLALPLPAASAGVSAAMKNSRCNDNFAHISLDGKVANLVQMI